MIFEGTYTVTHMPTHLQMAEESFHIGPVGLDGLLVESRHLLYGQNIATSRSSRVWVDANWMPSQIEMEYGFTNLEATVGQDETTVCVSDGKERKTTNYAVSRADLFFVLPGTLHAPLFATRRFCLKGGGTCTFQTLPQGECYIERRNAVGGQQRLWAELLLGTHKHTLDILVSPEGDLLSYTDIDSELFVELES